MTRNLASAEILSTLPDYFHPEWGCRLPDGIVGSTIVAMGGLAERKRVEGGGLVIDYIPKGSEKTKRVVLAFTELGMWIGFDDGLDVGK